MTDLVTAAKTGSPASVPKITSADIKVALRTHFSPPGYSVMYEVSNDTGARVKTFTDAVVVGIWPSTGQEIVGIEIKVSRSDWLREVKNPAKTSPMFDNCDRFYLACPSGMVPASEVPQNWGVLHFDGARIKVAKNAPPLEPKPLSRGLLAALVRRAGQGDSDTISAAVAKALAAQRTEVEERIEREVKYRTDRHSSQRSDAAKTLAAIEEIVGFKLSGWNADAETVGRAIKAVHDSGVESTYSRLRSLHRDLAAAARTVEEAIGTAGVIPDKML